MKSTGINHTCTGHTCFHRTIILSKEAVLFVYVCIVIIVILLLIIIIIIIITIINYYLIDESCNAAMMCCNVMFTIFLERKIPE